MPFEGWNLASRGWPIAVLAVVLLIVFVAVDRTVSALASAPAALGDGLVAFRVLLGGLLVAVLGLAIALWAGAERNARALRAQAEAIEEHNARLEAASALLRRRAEELEAARAEAVAARDEAQQANRAKSLFLANMSHELRTPLNAIMGYGELLAEEVPEHARADLDRILDSSRRLLAIISDILDLSMIEAGRLEIDLEWVALPAFLPGIVREAEPLARAHGNALRLVVAPGVERIRTDPDKLRQVLMHLLSNAAKFTERGAITLAVDRIAPDRLRFTVRDTGIGMTPEALARVFEPFVQGDPSSTRRHGGTGLGLTLVHLLVDRLGGELAADSRPGAGSTFEVTLPVEGRIRTTATGPPARVRTPASDGAGR